MTITFSHRYKSTRLTLLAALALSARLTGITAILRCHKPANDLVGA